MSDSVQPHRRQPTRLLHPWDSPGKNTGVVSHFLFQCMKSKSESEVAQSCPTLSDPMDCNLPGSPSTGFSRQEYWSGEPLPSPEMSWGQSFHQVYLLHFIRGPSHGTLTFITSSSSTVNIWIFCAYLSDVLHHKVRGGTSKCIFRLGRILLIQCSANFNLIGFYGLRMLNSVNNTDYKSKYISSSGQSLYKWTTCTDLI